MYRITHLTSEKALKGLFVIGEMMEVFHVSPVSL